MQEKIKFTYKNDDGKSIETTLKVVSAKIDVVELHGREVVFATPLVIKSFVNENNELVETYEESSIGFNIKDEELVRKAKLYKILQDSLVDFLGQEIKKEHTTEK